MISFFFSVHEITYLFLSGKKKIVHEANKKKKGKKNFVKPSN